MSRTKVNVPSRSRGGFTTDYPATSSPSSRPQSHDNVGPKRGLFATGCYARSCAGLISFRVNVALPIPFDGFGSLEVDLLCADARVAIELDGGQHLADPIAYRRDRRKDQLLQENGYFVLRFLAEDVGKELDAVLDAILRVLARHRQAAAKAEPLKFVRRGGE